MHAPAVTPAGALQSLSTSFRNPADRLPAAWTSRVIASPEERDIETPCYFGERLAPRSPLVLRRVAQRVPDQQALSALTIDQECGEHLR